MLLYLPSLTQQQFARLCESGSKGGMSAVEVSGHVLSGRWKCFEIIGRGLVAVSVSDDVLTVEGFWAENFASFMRGFRGVMDRLATEWKCNTVETWCFDRRLMTAMLRIEAQPIAWHMRWQVHGAED